MPDANRASRANRQCGHVLTGLMSVGRADTDEGAAEAIRRSDPMYTATASALVLDILCL